MSLMEKRCFLLKANSNNNTGRFLYTDMDRTESLFIFYLTFLIFSSFQLTGGDQKAM